MKTKFCLTLLFLSLATGALAQSNPGLIYGQVPTAGQWNSYFSAKTDYPGYIAFPITGGVFQGLVVTIPPKTTGAGFNLPPGTSPAMPNNGDIWTTNAGLFAQVNGVTQGPYITSASGGVSLSGNNTFTGNNTFAVGVTNVTGTFQLGGTNIAIGTSGSTVPFLSGNNTWSGTNTWTNTPTFTKPIVMNGSSSGAVTIQTQAAAGTFNFNLPITAGSAGQALVSQGGGSTAMTWANLAASVVPPPQGRLTLTSGTPVMTASATGAQTVYYAPYKGNQIPLYSGSAMTANQFTSSATDTVGLSLALAGSANWVANTVYDLFVAYNGGTPTLCTGPAWSSATARSAAGSIALYNGFPVNSNASAMTCRTGAASTISVPQYQATLVGTMATDAGTAGQVSFTYGTAASGGGAAVLNIWNYYNRVNVTTVVTDNGASYTYTTNTIRSARNSTTNRITFVSGLAEDGTTVSYTAATTAITAAGDAPQWGIGIDSTTAFTCEYNEMTNSTVTNTSFTVANTNTCPLSPQIGLHFLQALENSDALSNANVFDVNSLNAFMVTLPM